MRKLKLQMQMSLDGFVSTGPNDEQRWVTWALSDIYQDVLNLFDSTDTIILGRKLAVDYIPYWMDVETQPDHEMFELAKGIVGAKKIIFSKTLTETVWPNTEISNNDLVSEVNALKSQEGKDLIVYGGTSFVSALINEKLIDELHFFINPVAIGKGESIFSELSEFQSLKLKESIAYKSGIVRMIYELK